MFASQSPTAYQFHWITPSRVVLAMNRFLWFCLLVRSLEHEAKVICLPCLTTPETRTQTLRVARMSLLSDPLSQAGQPWCFDLSFFFLDFSSLLS